ncbi:MAG: MoxR family ATPase [Campylobacterota bacterium]|nr:MoxR family ATPase [Campylobacterota bacterium]
MANEKKWWIYEGKETTKGIEKLEAIKEEKPPWRKRGNHNATVFTPFGEEVIDAVNAAIYLRRPLLVTGEPGIGKSTLAKQLALMLTPSQKVLRWDITSKSTLKDALYSYDALARLHDIQMKKLYYELRHQENNQDVLEYANLKTGIENYLKLGAIGTAFINDTPSVVLIDEIDKSDIDLPNDLLHIFEEQHFEIPELKRLTVNQNGKNKKPYEIEDTQGNLKEILDGLVECQGDFPIIVMTSNGEREFPPAFLRRCISVHLTMPDKEEEKIAMLSDMVEAHFARSKEDERIQDLIKAFVNLDDGQIHTNDQLLNAVYLVLKADGVKSEEFKRKFNKTVWYPVG